MAIALFRTYCYLMSIGQIKIVIQEVNAMSKSHDAKKNEKTPPKKTAKEKRQEKREKKNK